MSSKSNAIPGLSLVCGIAGGVWALLGGFGALVTILGGGGLLPANLIDGLFFIILMGVLALLAMALYARNPSLYTIMVLVSVAGIAASYLYMLLGINPSHIFDVLIKDPLWLFLFPAPILLIIAFIGMRRRV